MNPNDQTEKPADETQANQPDTTAEDEAALARQIEENRQNALLEGTADSPGTDTSSTLGSIPQEDAQVIPVPEVGNLVYLNIPGAPLRTAGLVTGYGNGRSEINVTAFPDGEVPRPITAIPHIRVKPDAATVWYE